MGSEAKSVAIALALLQAHADHRLDVPADVNAACTAAGDVSVSAFFDYVVKTQLNTGSQGVPGTSAAVAPVLQELAFLAEERGMLLVLSRKLCAVWAELAAAEAPLLSAVSWRLFLAIRASLAEEYGSAADILDSVQLLTAVILCVAHAAPATQVAVDTPAAFVACRNRVLHRFGVDATTADGSGAVLQQTVAHFVATTTRALSEWASASTSISSAAASAGASVVLRGSVPDTAGLALAFDAGAGEGEATAAAAATSSTAATWLSPRHAAVNTASLTALNVPITSGSFSLRMADAVPMPALVHASADAAADGAAASASDGAASEALPPGLRTPPHNTEAERAAGALSPLRHVAWGLPSRARGAHGLKTPSRLPLPTDAVDVGSQQHASVTASPAWALTAHSSGIARHVGSKVGMSPARKSVHKSPRSALATPLSKGHGAGGAGGSAVPPATPLTASVAALSWVRTVLMPLPDGVPEELSTLCASLRPDILPALERRVHLLLRRLAVPGVAPTRRSWNLFADEIAEAANAGNGYAGLPPPPSRMGGREAGRAALSERISFHSSSTGADDGLTRAPLAIAAVTAATAVPISVITTTSPLHATAAALAYDAATQPLPLSFPSSQGTEAPLPLMPPMLSASTVGDAYGSAASSNTDMLDATQPTALASASTASWDAVPQSPNRSPAARSLRLRSRNAALTGESSPAHADGEGQPQRKRTRLSVLGGLSGTSSPARGGAGGAADPAATAASDVAEAMQRRGAEGDVSLLAVIKRLAEKGFFRLLTLLVQSELDAGKNVQPLLTSQQLCATVLAVVVELIVAAYGFPGLSFPALPAMLDISPYQMWRTIESAVRVDRTLPPALLRHLAAVEEQCLESAGWSLDSPLIAALAAYHGIERPSTSPALRSSSEAGDAHMEHYGARPSPTAAAGPSSGEGFAASSSSAASTEMEATGASKSGSSGGGSGGTGKIAIAAWVFLRKTAKLAASRLEQLCTAVGLADSDTEHDTWSFLRTLLDSPLLLSILPGSQLDLVLLCALYAVLKLRRNLGRPAVDPAATSIPALLRALALQRHPAVLAELTQVATAAAGSVAAAHTAHELTGTTAAAPEHSAHRTLLATPRKPTASTRGGTSTPSRTPTHGGAGASASSAAADEEGGAAGGNLADAARAVSAYYNAVFLPRTLKLVQALHAQLESRFRDSESAPAMVATGGSASAEAHESAPHAAAAAAAAAPASLAPSARAVVVFGASAVQDQLSVAEANNAALRLINSAAAAAMPCGSHQ